VVSTIKARVAAVGITQTAKEVDVTLPVPLSRWSLPGDYQSRAHRSPIKIRRCWLDSVPAYSGFGAVVCTWGQLKVESQDGEEARVNVTTREPQALGGGHVISDLIAGKPGTATSLGQVTDCYPVPHLKPRLPARRLISFTFNPTIFIKFH